MRKIELLSPAKSAEHGIEAINHGADAVYIGAPQFSARISAGNDLKSIEQLINYAHAFHAKVYVALNTILTDKELEKAEKLIHQLHEIGTDALIIQDFGITQLNLPPIALHASTQMDNRTPEKVAFLEKAGFEQVVLARELSLSEISTIAQHCRVKLEAFIHGALCVSYSGRCYFSQHICNRSANRGNCAQVCRLPYSLIDSKGKYIAKDKYLLSLKDMNRSAYIKEMIEAGISSFKIEGRLKDVSYVKNVTAYYRKILDDIIENNNEYQTSSSGKSIFYFTPNIEKSFHRGSTSYFLHGREKDITSFNTPKSIGEVLGCVTSYFKGKIELQTSKKMANGDGCCFFNESGQLVGFKVNNADGNTITPADKIQIPHGTLIYRNFDREFEQMLSKNSAERKIEITIQLRSTVNGFSLTVTDEDMVACSIEKEFTKELAKDEDKQRKNCSEILQKTGDTIFRVKQVELPDKTSYFLPASILSEWRRELITKLYEKRIQFHPRTITKHSQTHHSYPLKESDYRENVHNAAAKSFFQQHNCEIYEMSYEKSNTEKVDLMTCKHCLKYSFGLCSKDNNKKNEYQEPLFLVSQSKKKYQLHFNCKDCTMRISVQKNHKNI